MVILIRQKDIRSDYLCSLCITNVIRATEFTRVKAVDLVCNRPNIQSNKFECGKTY